MNRIFLTVDTECHDIRKENQYIWGRKNGKEYGIGRILELGEQYRVPINFFVDFAEGKRYGIDFIKRVVDKISCYKQPVFLHLHPNYISGEECKTYLWEYSKEEQKSILSEGINLYKEVMGKKPVAFRAGRYGVDKDTYDLIDELIPGVVDLSYTGGYGKMCHVEHELFDTVNHYARYKSLKVMPNCTYIALDLFGKKKTVGIDASEMSLTEFKEFIKVADGRDFVLTMHSWNFIDRLFWSESHVANHRTNERLFKGMVEIVRQSGYSFSSIEGYDFDREGAIEDIRYNACDTVMKKLRSLFLNFWRFQQMAKISKKYLIIYTIFYVCMFLALIGVTFITLH